MQSGLKRQCKVVLERDPFTSVEQSDTGDLVCNLHRTSDWCSHIQNVVQEQLDAGWPYEVPQLDVPIVPDLDVWAKVSLGKETAGGKMLYVKLPKGHEEFVGFVTPEEGRLVIRSMLHNWALPRFREPGTRTEGAECRAKGHGPKAEAQLLNPPSQPFSLGNMWSIVQDGVCLTCLGTNRQSDVPDV